ncbi:MAG: metallopeptidase TldD-related protein [Myxococcota bacterium]|nr:metallopeptidase TldD-related protein [Myxococcota bacterium]
MTDPASTLGLPELLGALQRHGAEHVTLRWQQDRTLRLGCTPAGPEALAERQESGLAVRILLEGAWGFAAGPATSQEAAVQIASRAVAGARQVAAVQAARPLLAAVPPARGSHLALGAPDDPAAALVQAGEELAPRLARSGPGSLGARLQGRRTEVRLLTSEGADLTQLLDSSRLQLVLPLPAAAPGDRSLVGSPATTGSGWARGGPLPLVRLPALDAAADELQELAAQLPGLPPPPAGHDLPLLLDAPAVGALLLATFGQALRADRCLGREVWDAGASFLGPADLGVTDVASPLVSLVCGPAPGSTPGERGWDDEGVAPREQPLVQEGVVTGLLVDRELAAWIPELPPSGQAIASHPRAAPRLVAGGLRLLPGPAPADLADLAATLEHGLVVRGCRQVTVDPLLLTFRFVGAWGEEIHRGRPTRLVRGPVLRGSTPLFWGRCVGLGGPTSLVDLGLGPSWDGRCGLPLPVGLRVPPALFAAGEVLGG